VERFDRSVSNFGLITVVDLAIIFFGDLMKNILAAGATLAVLLMAQPGFAADHASANNANTDSTNSLEGSILGVIATPIVVTVETTKIGTEAVGKVLQAGGEGVGKVAEAGGNAVGNVVLDSCNVVDGASKTGVHLIGDVVKLVFSTGAGLSELTADVLNEAANCTDALTAGDATVDIQDK
jgi:hypothetical protein